MHTLTTLSDDILILVCRYVQINDIFYLRQTARRLATFVLSYSVHIAPSIARNTFPNADLLLRGPEIGSCEFSWLKSLVPQYLAAVLVDRYRLRSPDVFAEYYGVPAESELGDGPRARVASGWRVLKRLSDISREVYRLPESRVPRRPLKGQFNRAVKLRFLSTGHHAADILERREDLKLKRRLVYLNDLDRQHIEDYTLMYGLLLGAFKTDHDPPSARMVYCYGPPPSRADDGADDVFDWGGRRGRRVHNGNSWINSFILDEGPMLFWRQWYGGAENAVNEAMLRAWKAKSSQQIEIARDAASKVEATMRSLRGSDLTYHSNIPEVFVDYMWYRIAQLQAGQPLPKETMEDLPFWINFQSKRN